MMLEPAHPYRGRFAPTPSGPLHLGSLLTALVSYLEARRRGGMWLLRIDDLDSTRNAPGAADTILRQLETHGLLWDETPRRQTEHQQEYEAALDTLAQQGRLYGCACTRAQLAQRSLPGPDGAIYDGHCRGLRLCGSDLALRVAIGDGVLTFRDRWQGEQRRELATVVGDFVLKRRDGLIAYQLACAVDEHAQRISEVVRGADLLGSSFRQLYLMQGLGVKPPDYAHLPVLLGADGRKLSKQNHAPSLDAHPPGQNLQRCLSLLGLYLPVGLEAAPAPELLSWAQSHWSSECLRGRLQIDAKSL